MLKFAQSVLVLVAAIAASVRATAAPADVAVFANASFVETCSTTNCEATNVISALQAGGLTVSTFTGYDPSSLVTAFSTSSVVVIPELELSSLFDAMTPTARDALRSAVTSGGKLMVFGTYNGSASQILSHVFGSTVGYVGSPGCASSAALNATAAAGTTFAGGPSTLLDSNATNSIAGWPSTGRVLYGSSSCCWVATAPVGAGAVGYIAYDFYAPTQANAPAWIDVTRRMVNQLRTTSSSFNYASPVLAPFNGLAPAQVVVSGAPPAIGTVQFAFNLNADLNATVEYFDVRLNGVLVGTVQQTGYECLPSAGSLSISSTAFNSARGSSSSITVQLLPSADVNYCTGSVGFTLTYPTSGTTEFSHTSANLAPFMYGANAAYTVPSAPAASSPVSLEFSLNGDFDWSGETFEVRLNGFAVATVVPATPQCVSGTCTTSIPAATFNAARGASSSIAVTLVPNLEVGACTGSVQTTMRYSAGMPTVTGVVASDGGSASSVAIGWNQHASALAYTVWRRGATGSAVQIGTVNGGTSTAFTDTTATALAPYWYSVVAVSGSGASSPSAEDGGWRNIVGPTVSASDGTYTDRVQLSWTSATGASGYRVYRSEGGGTPALIASLGSTSLSYADTSASPGITYSYQLASTHSLGESLLGAANTGFRSYSVPVGVAATDGTASTGVTVSWTAFPTATGYTVWRRAGTGALAQIGTVTGGATTSYADTASTALVGYSYAIRATIGATATGFSAEDPGWRNANGPTASASDGTYTDRVQISWPAVTGNGGYRLYRWTSGGSPALLASTSSVTTSYADFSATPGTVYSYSVTFLHGFGESLLGGANTGYRATVVPTNVVASDGTSASAVTIAWTGVPNASSYSVYRRVGAGTATLIATVTTTSLGYSGSAALSNDAYSVRATVGGVLSSPSAEDTGWRNVLGPGASASDGTYSDRVQVSWTAVSGSLGYRLYRWTGSNPPSLLTGLSSTTTSYADTTAAPGIVYSYALTTLHGLGESLAGTSNTGFRNTNVPQFVLASDGTSSTAVQVTWQAVPNATSYTILRRGTSGSALQVGSVAAPATSFAHTAATALSMGYYSVRAVVAGSSSAASAEDAGWRNINGPVVSASDGTYTDRVQLNWTPTSGASAHRVYRWTSGGSPALIATLLGTASSYTDTTATAGTVYSYAIATTHALGESLLGTSDTGYRLLTIPQNVVASDGTSATGVVVSWSSVQNATSYQVYRRGTSGSAVFLGSVSAPSTTYTHATVSALSMGYYSVRATVSGLASPASTEDSGWRNTVGPTATASDGTYSDRVQVSWTAVAGASGHRVYRWQSSGSPTQIASLSSTASSFGDTTAVPGTVYNYAVAYTHSLGESLLGTSNTGYRLQTIPQNVVASDGTSSTAVNISWGAVPGATSYLVYRRTSSGTLTQIGSVGGTVTSFAYTGATALTIYSFGVKAVIGTSTGALSAEDPGWKNIGAPAITASDGTYLDRVQLSWTAAAGVSAHRVYRWTSSTSPVLLASLGSTTSSYADTTAVAGTTYTYAIRTVHSLGESVFGTSDTGYRAWTTPQSVVASDGSSSSGVIVTWQAVPNAGSYRIYRRTSSGTASQIGTVTGSILTYTDTAASALVTYYYSVRAVVGSTVSSASLEDTGWKNALPVTGVLASDGTYSTYVRVTWSAHGSATGYKVFRQYAGGSYTQIAAVSSTTLSYNDASVPSGVTAFYYVVATHALGQTNPSVANSGYRSLGLAGGSEGGSDAGGGNEQAAGATLDLPPGTLADGGLGSDGPADSPLDESASDSDEGDPAREWHLSPSDSCPQAIRSIRHMVELFRRGRAPYTIDAETLDALLSILPAESPEDPESCDACRILAGDVDLDGSIDLLDVEAQLAAWASGDVVHGDVNRDGWIDLDDHLMVLEKVQGAFGQD